MPEKIVVGGPEYKDPDAQWSDDDLESEERARLVLDHVRAIEQRQLSISDGHRRHADIYAGYTPVGFSWGGPTAPSRPPVQATRNVIRSVCDTATALISKAWPRPRIVTDGAEWDVQRRAEQLDKFLVGAYRRAGVYKEAQLAFRDSTIFGTGAYILRECGTGADYHIKAERVLPSDLVVDELECQNNPGTATNWFVRRVMPVKVALRQYAKGDKAKADLIKASEAKQPLSWPGSQHVPKGSVVVVEAWYTGEPGRHVVCVEAGCLVDESWGFDWAPIVVLYWSPPVSGFYGDGVAYRQYGRQKRINYLYRWIQRCQDLIAVPRVWVDAANGPLKVQISNEIGEIVGYRGPKPEFQTPQAVGPELYNWLDRLEAGGFDDEGISQATAANQLPQGIESAPAQREYSFKEGTRFAPVSQRWEDSLARETATKMLALYREHYQSNVEGGSPRVTWSSRSLVEEIEWADVDLETEAYEIRVEASSLEDLSPAGRIQSVIELAQTGWIEPDEGRRLLGHPDLERSDKKGTAAYQHAEWISMNLKRGKYVPPNVYGDLEEQEATVKADLLNAEMGGAGRDADGRKAMALMRQFLRDIDVIMNPPADAMPMMGGDPAAAGAPMDPAMAMDPAAAGVMPPGVEAAPAPAMSLPASQGLGALIGTGSSRQNF